MTIRESFEPYRNEWGIFGWDPNQRGRSADNHILATAIVHKILKQNGELTPEDVFWFDVFLYNCWVDLYGLCRYPNQLPASSHDDHCGAAYSIPKYARRIYAHGFTHGWIFGETKSSNWLARFPHMCATASRNSNHPSLWWDFLLGLEYLWHGYLVKKGDVSVQILLWLISDLHYGKNRWLTKCIIIWNNRMFKQYGGMKEVMNAWHKNPEKPFVKYVREEFIWTE